MCAYVPELCSTGLLLGELYCHKSPLQIILSWEILDPFLSVLVLYSAVEARNRKKGKW